MRGEKYLTRTEQFTAVYNKGASWVNKLVVLKAMRNGLAVSRYGFSVSSRIGGAVVRNRVKRRLREILYGVPLKSGWDIVFIARPAAAKAGFQELNASVCKLLARAQLLEVESDREEKAG